MYTSTGAKWFTITRYPSPLGPLTIVTGQAGLCRLAFPNEDLEAIRASLVQQFPGAAISEGEEDAWALEVRRQLDEYFAGQRCSFNLPLDLRGTPFQLAIWAVLQGIPYGTTCSYREVAVAAGNPRAARAAGQAIGRNPLGIIIPCHRVIGAGGRLVGFSGGLAAKEWLLQFEHRNRTRENRGSRVVAATSRGG